MFSIAPGDTVVVLCDKKKGMVIVKADFLEKLLKTFLEKGVINNGND